MFQIPSERAYGAAMTSLTPASGDHRQLLRLRLDPRRPRWRAGDRVVATARRPQTLDDLVARAPERVLALPLDVTDQRQIDAAVARRESRFGRIDVLVNNAGYGSSARSRSSTTASCGR